MSAIPPPGQGASLKKCSAPQRTRQDAHRRRLASAVSRGGFVWVFRVGVLRGGFAWGFTARHFAPSTGETPISAKIIIDTICAWREKMGMDETVMDETWLTEDWKSLAALLPEGW
ncbi:MAG: hypothetical protein LBM04_00305, partial [Opitutaceae bacterium]|nr:hypothetical protein [Opitutaceae bacterium]